MRFVEVTVGTAIGGYRLEQLLGKGSMGAVYVAEDLHLRRRVALKVLKPELAEDERFRQRFLQESQLAAGLHHAHVVPIYAAGEEGGSLYLAMRLIDGHDLRALLRERHHLQPQRVVALLAQVASALDAAHAVGLVHRDVKPANVLVQAEPEEQAFLCDFGLAKHASTVDSLTGEGRFVGTLSYVAPEQIEGGGVGPASDQYALACVLYECLTGERPFERESELQTLFAHLRDEPPIVSAVEPSLGDGVDAVLARALAKDPARRFDTCGELIREAAAALGAALDPGGGSVGGSSASGGVAPRTFLIADIRGYTAFTSEHGDDAAARLVQRFADVMAACAKTHEGRLVEARGDEVLVVFESSRNALRAALAAQEAFADDPPANGVGIGVDTGEATPYGAGYRGGALNVAARLCALAGPGETLASDTTIRIAGTTDGLGHGPPRNADVKGLAEPVRYAEVVPGSRSGGARRSFAGRRTRVALVAGALLVAGASAALVVRSQADSPERLAAAGVAALDASSGRPVAALPLGSAPSEVAANEDGVWVLDTLDRTITQIDPATRTALRTFGTGSAMGLATGEEALWVALGSSRQHVPPASVSRIDPATGDEVASIPLPRPRRGLEANAIGGLNRQYLAVTSDAVWVIDPDRSVTRIDPATNRKVARVGGVVADNIAAGDGEVWVSERNAVAKIDPATNTVLRRIKVDAGDSLTSLAVGGGSVWAADPFGAAIWRVDPGTPPRIRRIPVEQWVAGVTFGGGAAWATNEVGDTVYRIDAQTNAVQRIDGLLAPRGIAADGNTVWVTSARAPDREAALPASVCTPLYFDREGDPDLILVSDLAHRGPGRTTQLAIDGGIRLALERRGFEAGGRTVGYQSCDSSAGASGAPDFFRCGTNAKSYARQLRVVAVVGSYMSTCSYLQIPISNGAPDGPLAMISPSNTYPGLNTEDDLYPTGIRSFMTLAAGYRPQGLALTRLAKELGKKRVYVLWYSDHTEPGELALLGAAPKLGVRIVGRSGVDADTSPAAVAEKVARARPDAVIFMAYQDPGTVAVIRALRKALGRDAALLVPDGFSDIEGLLAALGTSAHGMYVSTHGQFNEVLPPSGKQFVTAYEDAHGGSPTSELTASYGGAAAELVLDAIARTDGSRAAVAAALLDTQTDDSVLGNVSFDARGNLDAPQVTILRVDPSQRARSPRGFKGAVVDRAVSGAEPR